MTDQPDQPDLPDKLGQLEKPDKYDVAYRLEHLPNYGLLILTLKPDQKVWACQSTMVGRDPPIICKSGVKNPWIREVQEIMGKKSFILDEYSIKKTKADLYLAPTVSGSIQHYYLQEQSGLLIQSSHFLACSGGVEVSVKCEGIKSFFSNNYSFLLKVLGQGDVWFSSYGEMIEVTVSGDHLVDTSYVVAFEESLSYKVEVIPELSIKTLNPQMVGGDGLVCRFQGEGKLWLQCRQLGSLINFLRPFDSRSFQRS